MTSVVSELPDTKQCSSCNEIKPRNEYYVNNSKKDKLSQRCKKCDSEREKNMRIERRKKKEEEKPLIVKYRLESITQPGEVWVPIKDFENYYISNQGRIFSTIRPNKCKDNGLRTYVANNRGYLTVRLVGDDGKTHGLLLHRLLAQHFIPNEKNLPSVDHVDRNKTNNSLENLRWTTCVENSRNTSKYINSKGYIYERKKTRANGEDYVVYVAGYRRKYPERQFNDRERAEKYIAELIKNESTLNST